jgi:AraC-like DNA-binding protein
VKPFLRRVTINPQCSFSVRRDAQEALINNWHYHPEIELLLISKSGGTQIIGDKTATLDKPYHLVLIGPYLPHTFIHEEKYTTSDIPGNASATVAHFFEDSFGKGFLELPEMTAIKELLSISKYGLQIVGKTLKKVAPMMERLPESSFTERMLLLIQILHYIANDKEYEVITSKGFFGSYSTNDDERINKIYQYTFSNFHRVIKIEEVAAEANLAKESFCRYFKQKIRKTYLQFLMEIRIGQACRLLIEKDWSVAQIAYACGYNNISNFHHQFKKITGKSPLLYQEEYLKKINQHN